MCCITPLNVRDLEVVGTYNNTLQSYCSLKDGSLSGQESGLNNNINNTTNPIKVIFSLADLNDKFSNKEGNLTNKGEELKTYVKENIDQICQNINASFEDMFNPSPPPPSPPRPWPRPSPPSPPLPSPPSPSETTNYKLIIVLVMCIVGVGVLFLIPQ